jgi:hypothetical protein
VRTSQTTKSVSLYLPMKDVGEVSGVSSMIDTKYLNTQCGKMDIFITLY